MEVTKSMKEKLCILEARLKALVDENKYQSEKNKLLLDTLQQIKVLTEHIDELEAKNEARHTRMWDRGDQERREKLKKRLGELWEEMKINITSLRDSISTECMKRESEKPMPEKQKAISGSMANRGEDEEDKSRAGCTINTNEQKDAATELVEEGDGLRMQIGILSTAFI